MTATPIPHEPTPLSPDWEPGPKVPPPPPGPLPTPTPLLTNITDPEPASINIVPTEVLAEPVVPEPEPIVGELVDRVPVAVTDPNTGFTYAAPQRSRVRTPWN